MRPQAKFPDVTFPRLAGAVCGALTALLGLAVLIGWMLHSTLLIRFAASLPPMQRSTAVGFLLSGLALLGIAMRWPRFTILCAVIPAILAIASLLGQGSMAFTVALAFLAVDMGIVLAQKNCGAGRFLTLGVTGLLAAAAGAACGVNAMSGTCDPFAWDSPICPAFHAALGFLALAVGVIATAFDRISLGRRDAIWIPIYAVVSLALFRVALWHVFSATVETTTDAAKAIAVLGGVLSSVVFGVVVHLSLRAISQREELHTANRKLEAEMVQRQRAEEKAQQANRIKGDFLANVSHEIRTPMNGILGMISLALDSPSESERRDCLLAAQESAGSLLTVINDILDFSKIEAGKFSLEQIAFSLRDNLAMTMKSLTLSAEQKGLYLRWNAGEEVDDMVMGDPVRLRQIIVNLVGNAIKFTSSGGVTLSVRNEAEGTGAIRFTVKDTGIGIPFDRQREIFASFTQADSSTTRKYGGTGLGLAISRQLTAMFGGRMWVESEPGKGSAFHFTARLGVAAGAVALRPLPEMRREIAGVTNS